MTCLQCGADTTVVCVFVRKDGRIENRELPCEVDAYRLPIYPPFRVALRATMLEPPSPVSIQTEDFVKRGRMFDGSPIMCADGFDVKEALMTSIDIKADLADARLRDGMRHFIDRAYPDALYLAERIGDTPMLPHERDRLNAQRLVSRTHRVIVRVRTA